MPTNTSALSVISSHFEKFASCPVPKSPHHSQTPNRSGSSGSDIDLHLSSNAKLVLMTKIEFQKAETATSNAFTDSLKTKYVNLSQLVTQNGITNGNGVSNHLNGKSPVSENKPLINNHLKTPPNNNREEKEAPTSTTAVQKRVLYPPERIQLKWCKPVPVGAGLINCGNTCFLNSTLQALTHTAPLYNYLISEQHVLNCKVNSFCMLCEMERHMVRSYGSNSTRAFEPESILRKLTVIAKHLRPGRQEDAHEFLRFAVEKMQQACLNGLQKLDPEVKETTAMNAIFGGSIKSTVICQTCRTRSDKIDPIMDLCLELKQASTLEQALEHFIKPETLVGDNAYKCPTCKKPQPARKTLSIHRAPNILTFQLKRFGAGFSMFGGAKITKQIEFPERFNMHNFMSVKNGSNIPYSLYAVVVHEGLSANSGHYYAYIKHHNQWYMMNDTVVKSVSVRQVLGSQAYILFYIRDIENGESSSSSSYASITPNLAKQPQFTTPPSKLVNNNSTTPPAYKPATIPSSAPPIKMVIRLPQQVGAASSTPTNNTSAPKITSYSSQPLIAKRPAQILTTTPTPTKAPASSLTSPGTLTPSKPPVSVVTATRPLVDGFETSSSDDEDNNRLVIDELAPGGGGSSISFSKPPPERQKSPPVIKFIPPKPVPITPEPTTAPPVEPTSELAEPSEDGEVQGDETTSSASSKRRRKHRSESNEGDDDEGEHHRHHHRHKKHRHSRKRKHDEEGEQGEEEQQEGEVDDNEDEEGRLKKKKKKSKKHRHHSENGGESVGDGGHDGNEEEEEWVEKEPTSPTMASPPKPEPPPPPELQRNYFPLPPSYPQHPSQQPQQQQPSFALGAHVTSWDGGLNSIDSQIINQSQQHNGHYDPNDRWKRDFDDTLDEGRVKKVKGKLFSAKAEFETYSQNQLPAVFQQTNYGSGNAFQAIQNSRNQNEREGSHGSRPRSGASSRVSTPDGSHGMVMNGHPYQNNVNNNNGYGNHPRYNNDHHNGGSNNNNGHFYNNNKNNNYGDGGYQQSNGGSSYNDKFSRSNNYHNNNRYDTPPAHQTNGYNGRKDGPYPNSAPRMGGGSYNNNNNWRDGGHGSGGGRGNGAYYRRQWSFQQ